METACVTSAYVSALITGHDAKCCGLRWLGRGAKQKETTGGCFFGTRSGKGSRVLGRSLVWVFETQSG